MRYRYSFITLSFHDWLVRLGAPVHILMKAQSRAAKKSQAGQLIAQKGVLAALSSPVGSKQSAGNAYCRLLTADCLLLPKDIFVQEGITEFALRIIGSQQLLKIGQLRVQGL
jgi:hypothetical protein